MKHIMIGFALAAAVLAIACNKDTAGGPGAALPASEQATIGQTADSFSLVTPMMSTSLAQGEAKGVTIGIKRGKDIDQDVTLAFADVPTGVTIEPPKPVIARGESEANVTLKAADDAALGNFTLKVIGHPEKGPDATSELKISIGQK